MLLLAISVTSPVASSRLCGQESPTEPQDTTREASKLLVAYAGARLELRGIPAPGGSVRVSLRRILTLSAQLGVQTIAWKHNDDLDVDLLFSGRLQVGLADRWDRFELGLFAEAATGVMLVDPFSDPTYEVKQIGIEAGFGSGKFTWFGDVSLGTANRHSPDLWGQLGIGFRYRLSRPS